MDRKEINDRWEQGAAQIASELKSEMKAAYQAGKVAKAKLALGMLALHNQQTELARAKRDNPNAVLFGDWPQR